MGNSPSRAEFIGLKDEIEELRKTLESFQVMMTNMNNDIEYVKSQMNSASNDIVNLKDIIKTPIPTSPTTPVKKKRANAKIDLQKFAEEIEGDIRKL